MSKTAQRKPRYEVGPGRELVRDGEPVAHLNRSGSPETGYALTPSECDALTRRIAYLLTKYGDKD